MACLSRLLLCGMVSLLLVSTLHAAVFNVRDYGAVGDGVHDDSPAIAKAIQAAKQAGTGHTVLIPAGNYRLQTIQSDSIDRPVVDEQGNSKPLAATAHLLIANASHLTVRGEKNTQLIMTNVYEHGILLAGSDHVTIEQMNVEYDPLPFTQGLVETVDLGKKLVIVRIQEGYADLSREDFYNKLQARRMMIFDPKTRQLDHAVVAKYQLKDLKPLGDRRWQMQITSNPLEDLKPGHHLFTIIARRSVHAVMVKQSSQSTLQNLTIHSAPGCAYNLRDSEAIRILHCDIAIPAGSDRLMTTNADGVHCKYNKIGPEIAYCHFQGMDDDAVNIGGSFARVLDQPDSTTLLVHVQLFEPGDELVIVDGKTGAYMQKVHVKAACLVPFRDGINAMKLTLDQPIGKQVTQLELGEPFKAIAPVRLPREQRIVPSLVLNMDRCGKQSYIHHNTFENHRVRGVLIRASDTRIEFNTFRNLNGPAIFAGHEFGFLEGPSVENLTIANNRFENIRRSNVFVCNTNMDGLPAQGLENKRIFIRDNVFTGMGQTAGPGLGVQGVAIDLSNAKDVTITGNTFEKPSAGRDALIPLIKLGPTAGVNLKDNEVQAGLIFQ